MKSQLTITIEQQFVEALQCVSYGENRSLSYLIESILAQWLSERTVSEQILTAPGRFVGNVSREETYTDV